MQGRNHGFKVGESERRRREPSRGAEGGGVWVSPSPLREGSGEGVVPPPQKFFCVINDSKLLYGTAHK